VFRGDTAWRSLSVFSLVSSILGLCFLAALVGSLEARELTGLWQRLLLAVLFLWCAVIGLRSYQILEVHSEVGWGEERTQQSRRKRMFKL
jgi:hypothetical protein